MSFRSKVFWMLATMLALTVPAENAAGQQRAALRDFDYTVSANPELSFSNPAALSTLHPDRLARASLLFDKENGGLRDIDTSPDSWRGEAFTESYMKYSDRVSLYGKMSYSYDRGRKMGANIMMEPSCNPINFLEAADTTVGVRYKEMITLDGGLSYRIGDRLAAGLKVSYSSADRTKLKDPRVLNKWMDLGATAGIYSISAGNTSFGVDLSWRRTIESLEAKSYGTIERNYYVFVDYGSFYGKRELFDGDENYISASGSSTTGSARPMVNNFYGVDFQLVTGSGVRLFQELGYKFRDGHYGQRGSTTVTFCEFYAHQGSYSVLLTAPSHEGGEHRIGFDAGFSWTANNENVFRKTTEPGKNTVVEYFGSNRVLTAMKANAALSYVRRTGSVTLPAWEYGLFARGTMNNLTTTIYPFERSRDIICAGADCFVVRNLPCPSGLLSLRAAATFSMGFGGVPIDRTIVSSTAQSPRSADDYMHRQTEFETAPRAGFGLGVSHTWPLDGRRTLKAGVSDRFDALLSSPTYLDGRFRNIAAISIELGL